MDAIWEFEHSVDCRVPTDFAWLFWTDVSNWALDSDVNSVALDGPFGIGTRGVTDSKQMGRIEWRIAAVRSGQSAVLEFPAPGVLAAFDWSFKPVGEGTRITQRASLSGEQAAALVQSVAPSLEAGIPGGMNKLREAMEAAFKRRHRSSP